MILILSYTIQLIFEKNNAVGEHDWHEPFSFICMPELYVNPQNEFYCAFVNTTRSNDLMTARYNYNSATPTGF